MGKIFHRKEFSNYLGENRGILDTVVQFTQDVEICPQQITVNLASSFGTATLDLITGYSGGTLFSVWGNEYGNNAVPAWYSGYTRNETINPGSISYLAWEGYGTTFPSYYYYLVYNTDFNGWVYLRIYDSNRPIYSGTTPLNPVSYIGAFTGTTIVNGIAYPDITKNTLVELSAEWTSPCP